MRIELKDININEECPLCNSKNSNHIARIDQAPLLLGCIDNQDIADDKFSDFNLLKCNDCEIIFTKILTSHSEYSHLHSEALGGIWNEHHNMLVKYIQEKRGENIDKVLEIGPSSNPLTKKFRNKPKKVIYCDLIDELPYELDENEEYIKSMFPNIEMESDFDLIFASHVFEHAKDTNKFLEGAIRLLKDNGKFIISIPNFEHWIGNKFWNGITLEHTIYPFIKHINMLAKKNNIKLEYSKFKNHSIFFTFDKSRNYEEIELLDNKNENLGKTWCESINNAVKAAQEELEKYDETLPVFCAGASHLTQYPALISDYINQRITNVIDNSDVKNEKRLYGTKIIDKKFEYIKNFNALCVIVFSSPYREEMIKQIKTLNDKAYIIKP